MSSNSSPETDRNKTMFMHLVMMMNASALQNMGKTVNPMTGKTAIDLDGAAFAIDMLAMIEARTAGNLEPDEERLLKSQVASLRLNFVEVSAKAKKPETDASGKPPEDSASTQSQTPKDAGPAKPDKDNDANSSGPRFHKSYG